MSMLKVKCILVICPVTLKHIWEHITLLHTHIHTYISTSIVSSNTSAYTVQFHPLTKITYLVFLRFSAIPPDKF